jgi:hypothetical protein
LLAATYGKDVRSTIGKRDEVLRVAGISLNSEYGDQQHARLARGVSRARERAG